MEENLIPVTGVKIKRVAKTYNGVLAYVTINLGECIAIHDIRIVEVRDRHTKEMKRILAFPNRKLDIDEQTDTVKYTDIAHPTNHKYRKYLEDLIFKLYEKGVDKHE